jgi:hypothetical protein
MTSPWKSLDRCEAAIREGDTRAALAALSAVVGHMAIAMEDVQRRLHAIDGNRAAIHLSDLPRSDGSHAHPDAVNLPY